MRKPALAVLACVGVAAGILAERQAYDWADLRAWLPDLLAGWVLIGVGIALLAAGRPRGGAVLLLVAGFSWFAFNFATTGPELLEKVATRSAYLHRAPLLQLALALPNGRPATRLAVGSTALAWTAALVWPLWDADATALVLAVAFVVIAAAARTMARGRRRRILATRGFLAVALLAAAIAADAVRSIAGVHGGATDVTVVAYAAAVALAGVVLLTGALVDAPTALAERAVALEHAGVRLRDALRDLLGDERLEIGFDVGAPGLVDDAGVPLAEDTSGRTVTPVLVAGQRVAMVVHEPATLGDAATRSAVLAAVGLAAQRERLRAEVGRQADAVEASRRRLLLAEEQERRRLAERLARGPGTALGDVERLVDEALVATDGDDALAAAVARARAQLDHVQPDLAAPLRGLGLVAGDELVPALERLAAGLPLEAHVDLEETKVSPEVASALWFVCSESLANVVKHAQAGHVRVALRGSDGSVRLTVEDDGRGGADPRGSGLVGLADRVAALGGRLVVSSPEGEGTRVVADLPLGLDTRAGRRPYDLPRQAPRPAGDLP